MHRRVRDDYETAIVVLDELDKGASKRELGRRTGAGRSAVRHNANNRERYVGEPPEPDVIGIVKSIHCLPAAVPLVFAPALLWYCGEYQ